MTQKFRDWFADLKLTPRADELKPKKSVGRFGPKRHGKPNEQNQVHEIHENKTTKDMKKRPSHADPQAAPSRSPNHRFVPNVIEFGQPR
jgi:hypothetical protein